MADENLIRYTGGVDELIKHCKKLGLWEDIVRKSKLVDAFRANRLMQLRAEAAKEYFHRAAATGGTASTVKAWQMGQFTKSYMRMRRRGSSRIRPGEYFLIATLMLDVADIIVAEDKTRAIVVASSRMATGAAYGSGGSGKLGIDSVV